MRWHFCNSHLKCHGVAQKSEFLTRIRLRCRWSGTLPKHSMFVRCAAAILVGNPMRSAIAAHLPDEHFVIRVDGRVKSHHRRFWMRLEKACNFGISFRSTTSKCARCSQGPKSCTRKAPTRTGSAQRLQILRRWRRPACRRPVVFAQFFYAPVAVPEALKVARKEGRDQNGRRNNSRPSGGKGPAVVILQGFGNTGHMWALLP